MSMPRAVQKKVAARPAPRRVTARKQVARPRAVAVHSALVAGPRPHWELRTEGLEQELWLRVAKAKEELEVPSWAPALLSTLVARVQSGELTPDPNQIVVLANGVAPGLASELSGLAFTPITDGLLAVPVMRDEAKAVREWSPTGLIDVLARVDPHLVTDLERPSLLQSPRARVLIEQRMDLEGSSMSSMTAEVSEFAKSAAGHTWKLSSDAVETLISLLKGRIGHLRSFSVASDSHRVEVINADAPSVAFAPKVTTVKLSMVAARQLRAQLKAKPGSYAFEQLPGLTMQVV